MAVVISSEESKFFSGTPLERRPSQPKLVSKQSSGFQTQASTSRVNDIYDDSYHHPIHIVPGSSPSSAPSSPRAAHADSSDPSYDPSCSSTPATNLSLDGHCDDDDDVEPDNPIRFPAYGDNPCFAPLDELEPLPSPRTGDSYTPTPTDDDVSPFTSRPESPVHREHAVDDTAVGHQPTQHVDYLAHNWKEEDIWSSWRYIVSRRGECNNSERLENASWRTWMKIKYRLKTVSPETLNWYVA